MRSGDGLSPRSAKFRFYADEGFPAPAVVALRASGHNVLSVVERNKLRAISDLLHIRFARKEDRILLALDKDFLVDRTLMGEIARGPGVLLVSSSDPSSKKVIGILNKHLSAFSASRVKGRICQISPSQCRYYLPEALMNK